jgi:hypothetical protein
VRVGGSNIDLRNCDISILECIYAQYRHLNSLASDITLKYKLVSP